MFLGQRLEGGGLEGGEVATLENVERTNVSIPILSPHQSL